MPSPSDHRPDETPPTTPSSKKSKDFASLPALALELPFTMAGAMFVGAAIGYFLDRWLHTKPWLTLVFGALGFFAGLREVLRRLPAGNGNNSG
ncbi:MAG TPA: AtpZ/AtpI family protein [Methylomirabilota bacterium]|nr:AtpZ/AtpI family protein [Methylomirabilota bacterium]